MNKKITLKDICKVLGIVILTQLPSVHASSAINNINRQKNQILKENPGIELKVENVDCNDFWGPKHKKTKYCEINAKIPEKFYEFNGKRFYLEVDGVSLEEGIHDSINWLYLY